MRTDRDTYLMDLARRAAEQTTCTRRGVGCVLADHRGRVLAIAYNGVAAGLPHCNEPRLEPAGYVNYGPEGFSTPMLRSFPQACEGHDRPPGQDRCEAVHAEQNALVQCARPDEVFTAYVTLAPCPNCTKLLLNTGCQRILFAEEHQGTMGLELWHKAGRAWQKHAAG